MCDVEQVGGRCGDDIQVSLAAVTALAEREKRGLWQDVGGGAKVNLVGSPFKQHVDVLSEAYELAGFCSRRGSP